MHACYVFDVNYMTTKTIQSERERRAYLGPCQASMMELFAKIVNGFNPLTNLTDSLIIDVLRGPE